jgi:hypothetical protein
MWREQIKTQKELNAEMIQSVPTIASIAAVTDDSLINGD